MHGGRLQNMLWERIWGMRMIEDLYSFECTGSGCRCCCLNWEQVGESSASFIRKSISRSSPV